MAEPQPDRILEEINLNFFIQYVADTLSDGTSYYKLKIKISDAKGNKIEHTIDWPGEYPTLDVLKHIAKLFENGKLARSDKLLEGIREEVLIWLALLISRVY